MMPNQTAQFVDQNGFLLIKGCPLSSYGIFDYSAGQVGETDGDLMRIVKVYRPEASITDPELIASLQSVPFIDDHDYLNGDPDAAEDEGMAPEDKGIDGIITDNVYYEAPWLKGDLKIYTRRLQKAVRSGKKELSLGYNCKFINEPGTFKGEPYEYVQIDMRGNHIALVDEARVAGARVLDGLVFDSMRFDVIPSKNNNLESPMDPKENETADGLDPQLLQLLQALLPKLQAAVQAEGGEGGGDPATSPEQTGAEGDQGTNAGGAENAQPVPGGEGEPADGEGEFNLSDACAMLDELLPKLKAKAGMGEAAPTGDEGNPSPEANVEHEKTVDGAQGLVTTGKKEVVPEMSTEHKTDAGVGGKASPGPEKGLNTELPTGDAALKRLYADVAARQDIYNRVSPIIGAFDCSRMTANETAMYAVAKIPGLKTVKGQERVALDGYLLGVKSIKSAAPAKIGDSTVTHTSGMAAYLNGSK